MKGPARFLALSLALSGCGRDDPAAPSSSATGGSANGGTAGSTGGSGGSAGSAGGSSGAGGAGGGGAVTRGAVSLHVAPGSGCSIADTYLDFPTLPSGHPVDATTKGQGIENGDTTDEGPASVLCNWVGTQPPDATFSAVIKIGPAGAQRMISIGSDIDTAATVEAGVAFSPSDRERSSYGSTAQGPCHYDMISVDAATRSVWGTLRCDTFSTTDGSDTCVLAPSYFFFENCALKTTP